MKRLVQPLIPLMSATGASLDNAWMGDLSKLNIPERKRKGSISFSADLRWWMCEKHHDGVLLEALKNVDLSKIFPEGVNAPAPEEALDPIPGLEVEEIWSGDPIRYVNGGYAGSIQTIHIHTSMGTLTGTARYVDRCFGGTEKPVKKPDDLAIVRHIYEKRAEAAKPDVTDWIPMTAFQAFLIHWAGVQQATYIYADAPDEVEKTIELVEHLYTPVIESLAQRREWVYSCENLSSDVSASYWDRFVGPQLKRRVEMAAQYGAKWAIHFDGKVMPLLGRLHEVGVASADGLTAQPSGDLDPLLFRQVAGPDIHLHDILPQIIFVPDAYSEAYFEDYVRKVVSFYRDDGKVTLGIGDMLPINGSIARVEKVIDIIEELT